MRTETLILVFILLVVLHVAAVQLAHWPTVLPDEGRYLQGQESLWFHALLPLNYGELLMLNAIAAASVIFPLYWLGKRYAPAIAFPAALLVSLFPMFWAYPQMAMAETMFTAVACWFFWAAEDNLTAWGLGAWSILIKSLGFAYAWAGVTTRWWLYFPAIVAAGLAETLFGMGFTPMPVGDIALNGLKWVSYALFAPGCYVGLSGWASLPNTPPRARNAVLGILFLAGLTCFLLPTQYWFGRYIDSAVPLIAILGAGRLAEGEYCPKWLPVLAVIPFLGGWLFEGFGQGLLDSQMMWVQLGLFALAPIGWAMFPRHRALYWLFLVALSTPVAIYGWHLANQHILMGCGLQDSDYCRWFWGSMRWL